MLHLIESLNEETLSPAPPINVINESNTGKKYVSKSALIDDNQYQKKRGKGKVWSIFHVFSDRSIAYKFVKANRYGANGNRGQGCYDCRNCIDRAHDDADDAVDGICTFLFKLNPKSGLVRYCGVPCTDLLDPVGFSEQCLLEQAKANINDDVSNNNNNDTERDNVDNKNEHAMDEDGQLIASANTSNKTKNGSSKVDGRTKKAKASKTTFYAGVGTIEREKFEIQERKNEEEEKVFEELDNQVKNSAGQAGSLAALTFQLEVHNPGGHKPERRGRKKKVRTEVVLPASADGKTIELVGGGKASVKNGKVVSNFDQLPTAFPASAHVSKNSQSNSNSNQHKNFTPKPLPYAMPPPVPFSMPTADDLAKISADALKAHSASSSSSSSSSKKNNNKSSSGESNSKLSKQTDTIASEKLASNQPTSSPSATSSGTNSNTNTDTTNRNHNEGGMSVSTSEKEDSVTNTGNINNDSVVVQNEPVSTSEINPTSSTLGSITQSNQNMGILPHSNVPRIEHTYSTSLSSQHSLFLEEHKDPYGIPDSVYNQPMILGNSDQIGNQEMVVDTISSSNHSNTYSDAEVKTKQQRRHLSSDVHSNDLQEGSYTDDLHITGDLLGIDRSESLGIGVGSSGDNIHCTYLQRTNTSGTMGTIGTIGSETSARDSVLTFESETDAYPPHAISASPSKKDEPGKHTTLRNGIHCFSNDADKNTDIKENGVNNRQSISLNVGYGHNLVDQMPPLQQNIPTTITATATSFDHDGPQSHPSLQTQAIRSDVSHVSHENRSKDPVIDPAKQESTTASTSTSTSTSTVPEGVGDPAQQESTTASTESSSTVPEGVGDAAYALLGMGFGSK